MHSQKLPTEEGSELVDVDLTEDSIPETNDDWEQEFIVTPTITITPESVNTLLEKLFPSTSSSSSASTTSTTAAPDTTIAPLVKEFISELIHIEIAKNARLEDKQQKALTLFNKHNASIKNLNLESLVELYDTLIRLSRHPLDSTAKSKDAVYYALRYLRAIKPKSRTEFEDIPKNYSAGVDPFKSITDVIRDKICERVYKDRPSFLDIFKLDPIVQQHINTLIELGEGCRLYLAEHAYPYYGGQASVFAWRAVYVIYEVRELDLKLHKQFKETIEFLLADSHPNPSASVTERAARFSFGHLLNYYIKTTDNISFKFYSDYKYSVYEFIKVDYNWFVLKQDVQTFTAKNMKNDLGHLIICRLLSYGDTSGEEKYYLGSINNKKRQQIAVNEVKSQLESMSQMPADSLKETMRILTDLVRGKRDVIDADTSEQFKKFSALLSYFESEHNSQFKKIIGYFQQALEMRNNSAVTIASNDISHSDRSLLRIADSSPDDNENENDDHALNEKKMGLQFKPVLSSSSSSTSTTSTNYYKAAEDFQLNATIEEIFRQLEICKQLHSTDKKQQREEAKTYIGERGENFKKIIEDGKLTVVDLVALKKRMIHQVEQDQSLDYLCMAYNRFYPKGYYSPLPKSDSSPITNIVTVIDQRIQFLSSQKMFTGSGNGKTTEKRNSPEKRS